jgi:uncharacterized protein YlxW (UPF0749 family)
MSQHNNSEGPFNLANARVPFIQWISIVSMIVSVAFALSSRLTASDHTAVDVAKLQSDVAEMRKQMALRDDVMDMNKQLRELEIEVAKLSDRLDHK